jgi:molybdopterin-binding protein/molybdate transport repressor ModE-like protein
VTDRRRSVSSLDVALLQQIGARASVVAAARALAISRDRANYRLTSLARTFGGSVVSAARGGAHHGATRLTPLGDRIARGGFAVLDSLGATRAPAPVNVLRGTYHAGPPPEVRVDGALSLRVAFVADDGETVRLVLDPEAIVVARERFASSARNVLAATVESVRAGPGPFGRSLWVRAGHTRLRIAVTPEPIRALGLARGRRVYLYVKATALRRIAPSASPGSPRS